MNPRKTTDLAVRLLEIAVAATCRRRSAARLFEYSITGVAHGTRGLHSVTLLCPMAIVLVACALVPAGCGNGAMPSRTADAAASAAGESRKPNLLLITVDTLRADHLSCYGYGRPTSPHIDALARSGVRFENAYVQRGLTWPSLASIMCSVHPVTHGVRANGQRLKRNFLQLAQVLSENGYTCGAVLTNAATQDWQGFAHVAPPLPVGADHDATRLALEWLGDNRGGRFFLWIHYSAPHAAYDPPAPYRHFIDPAYDGPMDGKGSTLADATVGRIPLNPADLDHIFNLYDGEVRYTDDEIGAVLKYVDEAGLRQSTMVVFTADHGEELFQHHRYFGHGASMYQGVLQVPLIMSCDWTETKGTDVDAIVQSIDIAPTILELF
jgi:arylsulfatase A-like enzyme